LFEPPSELPELFEDELLVALPNALLTPPVETDATLPANWADIVATDVMLVKVDIMLFVTIRLV
jgi:hypothetical protein